MLLLHLMCLYLDYEGLWLGSDKHRQHNCNLYGTKWPDQIRCLGIYVG